MQRNRVGSTPHHRTTLCDNRLMQVEQVLVMAGVVVVVLVAWVVVMLKLVVLVPPNRIAVLSGRAHMTPDGRKVGYRIVEGRQIRLPVIEMLDYLPELPPIVAAEVSDAYFAQNDTGPIAATATVSYATGPARHHAVERFLGQPVDAVRQVIVQLLEGRMREVASRLTRDQLQQDPDQAADLVRHLVSEDLERLGVEIMSVTLGRSEDRGDSFAQRLREAGLLDIAAATELACDVAGDLEPKLDTATLAAAGAPSVAFAKGRVTLRWSTAQVPPDQLIAGARALAAVRQDPRAYR